MFTKTKKFIALVLVCSFALLSLASCDSDCDHEYGDWEVSKEATCIEKGYVKYVASAPVITALVIRPALACRNVIVSSCRP